MGTSLAETGDKTVSPSSNSFNLLLWKNHFLSWPLSNIAIEKCHSCTFCCTNLLLHRKTQQVWWHSFSRSDSSVTVKDANREGCDCYLFDFYRWQNVRVLYSWKTVNICLFLSASGKNNISLVRQLKVIYVWIERYLKGTRVGNLPLQGILVSWITIIQANAKKWFKEGLIFFL